MQARSELDHFLCQYSRGRLLCSPLSQQFGFGGERSPDGPTMCRGDTHPKVNGGSEGQDLVDSVALDCWEDQLLHKFLTEVLTVN